MPDPSSLYPQPQPAGQGNALMGNPLDMMARMQQLQAGQLQLQQSRAQQAGGQAILSGMRPDGTFDPAAAMKNADPNAVGAAGAEFGGNIVNLRTADTNARNANTVAATNAVNLETTKNNALGDYLVGFAGKNLTPTDLQTIRATAVRLGGDPNVWGNISTPAAAQEAIKNAVVARSGASNAAAPVANGVTADLAPKVTSGAIATRTPDRVTGATPQQTADVTEYTADQTTAAATMRSIRPFQQALPLIEKLSASDFGTGSPEFAKLKGLLTTSGVITDPNSTSLPMRQEVNKYLHQALSALPMSGRSDQAQALAELSSPSLDLTQPATLSLVKNAIGMARMDAALPSYAGEAQGYKDKKAGYYQGMDPRAFQFDLMSKDDQAKLKQTLKAEGPKAVEKFKNSYNVAVDSGAITPPGGQ